MPVITKEKLYQISLENILSGRGKSEAALWTFGGDVLDMIGKIDISENIRTEHNFQIKNGQVEVPGVEYLVNYRGRDMLKILGDQIYNDAGGKVNNLSGGGKYNTEGSVSNPPHPTDDSVERIYVEKIQLGGGGINMLRAMSQHSKELNKLYTSLHVDLYPSYHSEGTKTSLDEIIKYYKMNGTMNNFSNTLNQLQEFMDDHFLEATLKSMDVEDKLIYVSSEGGSEPRNFIIYEVDDSSGRAAITDKIIIRGTNITNPKESNRNTTTLDNVGTIVINSVSDKLVFDEALAQYERIKGNKLGIICLTEKMDKLYGRLNKELLPNGFITVLNEGEVLKYENSTRSKDYDKGGFRLDELYSSIRSIWKNQNESHSRTYVTLGPYGCIGVDEDGTIYRTSVFKLDGDDLNTNGAGDTFLSMVVRLEHEKTHLSAERKILEVMALASGTAAYFIENQNMGKTVTESNVKNYLRNKTLQYELLGNINSLDQQLWQGKLSHYPIGSEYNEILLTS